MVAVTSIHEPDMIFAKQLIAEYDRLDWEVIWHFNNISDKSALSLANHRRTLGYTYTGKNPQPYKDYDYVYALDMAAALGAKWTCVHNADETLEPAAPSMLEEMLQHRKTYIVRWYNIWEKLPDGRLVIRTDAFFVGHKTRFFPLGPWVPYMKGGVSTPYVRHPGGGPEPEVEWRDLRIMHWGFSTPELRRRHYEQWGGTNQTAKVNSDYWEATVKPGWLARAKFQIFDPSQTHKEFMQHGELYEYPKS